MDLLNGLICPKLLISTAKHAGMFIMGLTWDNIMKKKSHRP